MNDVNLVKEILLRHRGRNNAIKSKEISALLGLPLEDTQAVTRSLIRRVSEMLPVVSCYDGYFIPENEIELGMYNKEMQRRIDGIKHRMIKTNENYKNWVD